MPRYAGSVTSSQAWYILYGVTEHTCAWKATVKCSSVHSSAWRTTSRSLGFFSCFTRFHLRVGFTSLKTIMSGKFSETEIWADSSVTIVFVTRVFEPTLYRDSASTKVPKRAPSCFGRWVDSSWESLPYSILPVPARLYFYRASFKKCSLPMIWFGRITYVAW